MSLYTHIDRGGIRDMFQRVGVAAFYDTVGDLKIDRKPRGLWYSVDEDWEQWCSSEMRRWLVGQRYSVDVGDSNILRLTDALAVQAFDERYGRRDRSFIDCRRIDWAAVGAAYDGIEIAPYQWSLRMGIDWYYGWDCASGCIWRPRGVKLSPIEAWTPTETEAA